MSEGRPPLRLVALPSRPDALERVRRFEAGHPEVTIVRPEGLSTPWKAVIPAGAIPGHPGSLSLTSYAPAGLADDLGLLFPDQEEDLDGGALPPVRDARPRHGTVPPAAAVPGRPFHRYPDGMPVLRPAAGDVHAAPVPAVG
jgi:hypothetical protein